MFNLVVFLDQDNTPRTQEARPTSQYFNKLLIHLILVFGHFFNILFNNKIVVDSLDKN